MGAFLEWIQCIVRSGDGCNKKLDPYSFVCTVIRINDEEAHIVAGGGKFTKQDYIDIKNLLNDIGFKKITWERVKPTGKRTAADEMKT